MADPQVKYDTSLPTAGHEDDEGAFHSLLSSLFPSIFTPGPTITVNPNNTANVQRTIQHEKIHALLSNLNSKGTLDKLNDQNPYFKQIASKLVMEPGNDASTEAPAYTGTGEASQVGIPPILSKQYNDYLRNQLFKLDPNLANQFQKLSTPMVDTSVVGQ
jgi:hypothetical protein